MRGITAAVSSATIAAALAMSGCSIKNDNPDLIAGKQMFVAKCGSCHVLGRAGTKGAVGPNLDEAFRRAKIDGLGQDTIRGVVKKQIEFPSMKGLAGTGIMPANLVNDEQAQNVAAYVAQVAAAGGKDQGLLAVAVKSAASNKPAVAKGGILSIPADPTGQLAFVNSTAQAPAGPITIEMPNTSGVPHDIAIKGLGQGPVVPKGTSSFKADLKPGTYTYFCSVDGHLAAGMKGTLTVK
ncbi:MAG: c-type cytochrome [Solirubrobacterales bacterium]|nr:c-type cytochrome [Solirubrobacterales bacterium]